MPRPKTISVWLDSVPDQKRFPALSSNQSADVVVIGGGIAGLLTAWNLAVKGVRVAILEKNHLATGDTGATTGFLTRVPDTSIADLVSRYDAAFATRIFHATGEAQEWLFALIRKENIPCDFYRCSSLYGAYAPNDTTIESEWGSIKDAGANARRVEAPTPDSSPFAQAIQFANEGSFHGRKFLAALSEKLHARGVAIWEESEAIDIDTTDTTVIIRTSSGSVTAKKVILTVGNPGQLMPELQSVVEANVSYVIAAQSKTLPIGPDLYWDTQDPYFYYRRIDDHTMILGGCDIAFDQTSTQKPFERLKEFLEHRWPNTPFDITHHWSGSLFETVDGLPYCFVHPHRQARVLVATGFGGNGLIFSTLCARILADLATDTVNAHADLFSWQRSGITIPTPLPKQSSRSNEKTVVTIATTDEFTKTNKLKKIINGQEIILLKTSDGYHALNNVCTHAGGSLCDGIFDGNVIECPLHAARFNAATGAVVGPPAVRALQSYPVTLKGNTIRIEIAALGSTQPAAFTLPEIAKHPWRRSLAACALSLGFWVVEFSYQYFWLIPRQRELSLVRSFALAGATLIGLALLSSSVFKWFPRTAKYWRARRYLGVAGFVFGAAHAYSVYAFLFAFDIKAIYFSLNPFVNPILFGSFALPIFMVMAFTSTDWAMRKLTHRVWKFIHRFVYIAFLSLMFHFVLINPQALKNIAGTFLLTITAATLTGQFYWFMATVSKRGIRTRGAAIGLAIILITIAIAYRAGIISH